MRVNRSKSAVTQMVADSAKRNWTSASFLREGDSMRTFTCAAIMLIAVAEPAFAQAGTTGGTLGNTDKSISGDRREEPAAPRSQTHRSAPAPPAAKSTGCGNAVGVYKGFSGITTIIKSGGTAALANGTQGNWTCANGQVTIVWNNGFTDHLRPKPGGFSAVNNVGGNSSSCACEAHASIKLNLAVT